MSLGRLQLLEKSDPSAHGIDTNNRGSRGVIATVPLPWRAVFDNGKNPELRPSIPKLVVGKKAVNEWLKGEHDSASEEHFARQAERALATN